MIPSTQQAGSLPAPDPDAAARSQRLVDAIAADCAAAGGWLSFDRFMERALYTPGLGYYSGANVKFGTSPRDGSDFVTAPELSPFFARTVARVVAPALAASATDEILEFGAGSGRLAGDLLAVLDRDAPGRCRRYTVVELSGELRERQRQTIARLAPEALSRVVWLDALPPRFDGVVLGNEVLDAMPVRLFARREGVWQERGIAVDAASGRLAWQDRAVPAADLPEQLQRVPGRHDYLTETHEAAGGFVRTVATMLGRGAALLFDYGFPAREYYHAQRDGGTLMCHYRHRSHDAPLFLPGLQDITAHVDFTFVAEAAVAAGASLYGYTSQARFLLDAGILDALAALDPSDAARYLPAANAVQKLLSEAEMGELFKVIAFGKGLPDGLPVFDRGDRSWMLDAQPDDAADDASDDGEPAPRSPGDAHAV
ncbi:class I SAM-dependent methyltransferase [Chitinasiproducens palmae]|uniref:SAM-dependent methyltransferase, MidA family n=1 Tax=Chitinasiproducens palmae TaxID=1770053 RepID=A0A1H2PTA4_9BURK|nr:SAM-dependent methyltransferase [Chitinasiproducens palmae]SDV50332.1 SAM-dependent methyltransferase, MidA family [Chitinasiproducens palmae]